MTGKRAVDKETLEPITLLGLPVVITFSHEPQQYVCITGDGVMESADGKEWRKTCDMQKYQPSEN